MAYKLFKKCFENSKSIIKALKVAGQVAGESNSSRNISNNLDFSTSLQKYKQVSTPVIIIFIIFSPFKRTGKPKINLKSFQWEWTGLAKKCGSIQFPSFGSWQNTMRSKLVSNRYEFEANKRNNLIFYGLAGGEKETPQQLRTKVWTKKTFMWQTRRQQSVVMCHPHDPLCLSRSLQQFVTP